MLKKITLDKKLSTEAQDFSADKIKNMLLTLANLHENTEPTELDLCALRTYCKGLKISASEKNYILEIVKIYFPLSSKKKNLDESKIRDKLTNHYTFLINLMTEYSDLRHPYRDIFKAYILGFFKLTGEKLAHLTNSTLPSKKIEPKETLIFSGFIDFAHKFTDTKIITNKLDLSADKKEEILDAFAILNECIKENPQLFSNLVYETQLLRKHCNPYKAFSYLKTNLDKKSNQSMLIDALCSEYKNREILTAQLVYIIKLVAGDYFIVDEVANELQKEFPLKENLSVPQHMLSEEEEEEKEEEDSSYDSETHTVYFTHNSTRTEEISYKFVKKNIPPNPKPFPCIIPAYSDSAISSYLEKYVDCDGITLKKTFENNLLTLHSEPACINPILDILDKTWSTTSSKALNQSLDREISQTYLQRSELEWDHFLRKDYDQVSGKEFKKIKTDLLKTPAFKNLKKIAVEEAQTIKEAENLAKLKQAVNPNKVILVPLEKKNKNPLKNLFSQSPYDLIVNLDNDLEKLISKKNLEINQYIHNRMPDLNSHCFTKK